MNIEPVKIARGWTIPQALYVYAGIIEKDASDARTQFLLLVSAIGSVFAKGGDAKIKEISEAFTGLPVTPDDIIGSLTEQQRLVLFGKPEP